MIIENQLLIIADLGISDCDNGLYEINLLCQRILNLFIRQIGIDVKISFDHALYLLNILQCLYPFYQYVSHFLK